MSPDNAVPKRIIRQIPETEENIKLKHMIIMLELCRESDEKLWKQLLLLQLDDVKTLNGGESRKMKNKSEENAIMNHDIDYEIYQYVNQQAESYIPLGELLAQRNLSYDSAKHKTAGFREKYHQLQHDYHIRNQNVVMLCLDLMTRMEQLPGNQDLEYLYFCTVTDAGLLNEINLGGHSEEQCIRNYISQKERVQELMDFMQMQSQYQEKFKQLRKNLKKIIPGEKTDCMQEFELLYKLTLQHTFLYRADKKQSYYDNLHSLLMHLNSNQQLKSVKPYLIFAVLSRKHGMMLNREHFIPNLQTVFQYQDYQIHADNGKNFNYYVSYLELYDHLRRFYQDDSDIDSALCDFCFANASPLSEFYYQHCRGDCEIPINLKQKVLELKAFSFPQLFRYDDYLYYDIQEFETKHSEIYQIWEKTADTELTAKVLKLLGENTGISSCISELPYGQKYPRFAELFLFQISEMALDKQMTDFAQKIIMLS